MTDGERTLMGSVMGDKFRPTQARMVEADFIGMRTRVYPPAASHLSRENQPAVQRTDDNHPLRRGSRVDPRFGQSGLDRARLCARLSRRDPPARRHVFRPRDDEMTHIWQWQNRDITGYSPITGASEHQPRVNLYLFDPDEEIDFLSMGYEQQAALVGEFVCCRTPAPTAPRTQRLYDTLSAVMAVQHPTQTPVPLQVTGVYENANLVGICD